MSEYSGFWSTGGTKGDQQTSYDQTYWTYATKAFASCNGYQGVASSDGLNGLEGTAAANTVAIATGSALVDGKFYRNSASQDVNIPSADSGNTRIDRIVLRADWANFNVSVYRIAGTQSTGTPSAPAITQTGGTTYDIMLYQALVNAAGDVSLTDERVWALPHLDESTLTSLTGHLKVKAAGIDSAQIAAGAIDLAHMSVNSIDSDQYVDGSIDLAHMSVHSVDSPQIVHASIDLEHMSVNSVDSDQYVDGSIDHIHLAANAVEVDNILDDTITGAKLAHGAVGDAQLDAAAVSHTKLGTGVVEVDNMAANSVDSDQYVDGSIDHVHLAGDAVDGDNIADDSIHSEHIDDGIVLLQHMSVNSIDSDQYVDGSIDHAHLAADIVDDDNIGLRVPMLNRRQGGGVNDWHTTGDADILPGAVRMNCGSIVSSAAGAKQVFFSVAFAYVPIVFISPWQLATGDYYVISALTASSFSISIFDAAGTRLAKSFYWLAIGPE
jgi:hypothetical protein